MKKLLMMACLASGVSLWGASNSCSDESEEDIVKPSCALYDVKFTLKTLLPKAIKCSDGKEYYFEQGSRTFDGVIWDCEAVCATMAPGEDVKFCMWESKRKMPVTKPLSRGDGVWEADLTSFEIMDRFSKKSDKVECFWPIECDDIKLYAAGFGKFDVKNMYVVSVSGNAAGKIVPAAITVTTEDKGLCGDGVSSTAFPGKLLALCDEFSNWCDDGEEVEDFVAACGTWSIKYNKTLSKGKKRLDQIIPSYAHDY